MTAKPDTIRAACEATTLEVVRLVHDGAIADAAGIVVFFSAQKTIADAIYALVMKQRAEVWERAAKIVEAPVNGVEINRFFCNGLVIKDSSEHDRFISTMEVSNLLRRRTQSIRQAVAEEAKEQGT